VRPAIPPPPEIPRPPLTGICVLSGFSIVVVCVVVSLIGDPRCERGCSTTNGALLLAAAILVPVIVTIVSASLVARVTVRIGIVDRIWVALASATGVAVGIVVLGGPDEGATLVLWVPVIALILAPFTLLVATFVSWGFEGRGWLRRIRSRPARPDVRD
jgi:uncharacterized membrane protein HdeD (DUF308 family)